MTKSPYHINLISAILVVAQSVVAVLVLCGDGDVVSHWNFRGEADGWGSRSSIILLTVFNVMSASILYFLYRHPQLCNIPRPFKDRQIGLCLMKRLVAYIWLDVSLLFLFITASVFFGHMLIWGIYLLIAVMVVTTVVGVVKLTKA